MRWTCCICTERQAGRTHVCTVPDLGRRQAWGVAVGFPIRGGRKGEAPGGGRAHQRPGAYSTPLLGTGHCPPDSLAVSLTSCPRRSLL